MKTFLESKNYPEYKVYQITVKDGNSSLLSLLEYIKDLGNIGHTFPIIVDPHEDREKTFNWDGDGLDTIKEIKEINDKV